MFVRGEGVHLYDENGKSYLDALSGLFVVQVGHGHAELPTPPPRRPRGSRTTRSGPRPTRRRSSWRPGSPATRPAT